MWFNLLEMSKGNSALVFIGEIWLERITALSSLGHWLYQGESTPYRTVTSLSMLFGSSVKFLDNCILNYFPWQPDL